MTELIVFIIGAAMIGTAIYLAVTEKPKEHGDSDYRDEI